MATKPIKSKGDVKSKTGNRQMTQDGDYLTFGQTDPRHKAETFVMNSFKPPVKPNPGKGGGNDSK